MTNQKDLVSIIIPVYNADKYVEETIQSVINQSYDNWELILIDDGSQDNSVDIIDRYLKPNKIILLQHPEGVNLGVSKTRELGIKFAKGEFIAFLDADDVFYANKLNEQLKIFSKYKDVILVHSKVEILNNSELKFNYEFVFDNKDKEYKLEEQENWLIDNRICNSTVIVKSFILKEIKFSLPQLFQFEDWLLWSLVARKGNFYYQNSPQIKYRIHPNSATGSILKNKLITPYSKIEYLISFYLLNDIGDFNSKIIEQLKGVIAGISEVYSNDNLEKISSFKLDFYDMSKESIIFIDKNNELLTKCLKLENELNEIKNIKKSIIFKLIIRAKKFFKKIYL